MKFLRSSLFLSLLEVVVGILLLVNPVGFTSGIIMAFGAVMLIVGFFKGVEYFRTPAQEAAEASSLTIGIILVLVGLVAMIKTNWILATFPVVTLIYGIVILVAGVHKLQKTVDQLRSKEKFWYLSLIAAALTIIFAVLIIANPFATTEALWMFTGITLLVEAAVDMVSYFLSGGKEA